MFEQQAPKQDGLVASYSFEKDKMTTTAYAVSLLPARPGSGVLKARMHIALTAAAAAKMSRHGRAGAWQCLAVSQQLHNAERQRFYCPVQARA